MDQRLKYMMQQQKLAQTQQGTGTGAMSGELQKLASILIRDPKHAPHREDLPANGQLQYAKSVTGRTMQSVIDAENIVQLLPEIELAIQVLISQILSPKDLINISLIYENKTDALGDVAALLNKEVSEHMDKDYKITDKLKHILRQTLFEAGSKPMAVIPRSRIDSIINQKGAVAKESFADYFDERGTVRQKGVLGNAGKTVNPVSIRQFANEDFHGRNQHFDPVVVRPDFKLTVTDNSDVLKIGELMDKIRSDRISQVYGQPTNVSLETESPDVSAYRPRFYRQTTVLDMTDRSEEQTDADGEPLIFDFPPESVFPVYPPSNPTKHLGYYVLLDENGQFVRKTSINDFYRQFGRNMQGTSQTSQMMERMRMALADFGGLPGQDDEAMLQIFSKVVEEDLQQRIKNGMYNQDVKLGYTEEVYRIMFARSCMQMQTQLLFIPIHYMTYFAFDYNENGVGKSLIENTRLLASYRAIVGMANLFAMVKNSINYRKLSLQLDPKDPDPDRTIEFTVHELARQTSGEFPIGEQNPVHIASFFQNAGIQLEVTGHPRIPELKADLTSNPGSNVQINTELDELLERKHNAAIGVPTEAINSSADINYVAQILQTNLLSAKRAIVYQETFCPQLTDFVRKYITSHGAMMKKLRKIVSENRKQLREIGIKDSNTDQQIVMHYLNNLNIELPKPDFNQVQAQLEEFKSYSESLSTVLDSALSDDVFGSDANTQLSQVGGSMATFRAIVKSYLERKWLKERNIMPEIFGLFADLKREDESLSKFLRENNDLGDGLRAAIFRLMKSNHQKNKIFDMAIEKLTADNEEGSDSGGGEEASEESSDSSGEEGGDDSSGGDGFDDDFGDDSDAEEGQDGEGESEGDDQGEEDSAEKPEASKEEPKETPKETKDDKSTQKEASEKVDDAFKTPDDK